jgi:hypothetical protein
MELSLEPPLEQAESARPAMATVQMRGMRRRFFVFFIGSWLMLLATDI